MATAAQQPDDDLDSLIDANIARYGYASRAAYLRDLIRRDEAREEWLRSEIEAGFASGFSKLTGREIVERAKRRSRVL